MGKDKLSMGEGCGGEANRVLGPIGFLQSQDLGRRPAEDHLLFLRGEGDVRFRLLECLYPFL